VSEKYRPSSLRRKLYNFPILSPFCDGQMLVHVAICCFCLSFRPWCFADLISDVANDFWSG